MMKKWIPILLIALLSSAPSSGRDERKLILLCRSASFKIVVYQIGPEFKLSAYYYDEGKLRSLIEDSSVELNRQGYSSGLSSHFIEFRGLGVEYTYAISRHLALLIVVGDGNGPSWLSGHSCQVAGGFQEKFKFAIGPALSKNPILADSNNQVRSESQR
ncbi:MAG: hypothetical protein IPL83_05100 [Bdellovibrionales bacterium]|nr:hypothetical protein [Bdellovibrionales bacterium]